MSSLGHKMIQFHGAMRPNLDGYLQDTLKIQNNDVVVIGMFSIQKAKCSKLYSSIQLYSFNTHLKVWVAQEYLEA